MPRGPHVISTGVPRDCPWGKEIAKFCKGDIFAWGREIAKASFPLREYREDAEVDEIEYRKKYQLLGEELLTKGGYRLAKVLNDILK